MFGSNKKLGEYLKEKRINANFSQMDLASSLGYSTAQFVSNWERGIAAPPADKFYDIIKLLKMDKEEFVDFLLDLEEEGLRDILRTKNQKAVGRR